MRRRGGLQGEFLAISLIFNIFIDILHIQIRIFENKFRALFFKNLIDGQIGVTLLNLDLPCCALRTPNDRHVLEKIVLVDGVVPDRDNARIGQI